MAAPSPAAYGAARRVWSRDGRITAPDEMSVEVDRVCLELSRRIARWIGPNGYDVILNRALGVTRGEHPALGAIACRGSDGVSIAAAVRAHGAAPVSDGIVSLIATVIDLLGRVIGEEIAVQIVEQPGAPGGARNMDARGESDG